MQNLTTPPFKKILKSHFHPLTKKKVSFRFKKKFINEFLFTIIPSYKGKKKVFYLNDPLYQSKY